MSTAAATAVRPELVTIKDKYDGELKRGYVVFENQKHFVFIPEDEDFDTYYPNRYEKSPEYEHNGWLILRENPVQATVTIVDSRDGERVTGKLIFTSEDMYWILRDGRKNPTPYDKSVWNFVTVPDVQEAIILLNNMEEIRTASTWADECSKYNSIAADYIVKLFSAIGVETKAPARG